MKLIRVQLENFRGYQSVVDMPIDDLTVIIGKNDVGKSTWLDALSIFFEEGSTKPDKKDVNIAVESESFMITASFQPPETMIIDASNPVRLQDEFLLDADGVITVKKKYDKGKLTGVYLVALHPDHERLFDLLNKTIQELKDIAIEIGVDPSGISGNKTKAATWRRAIRDKIGDSHTRVQEIRIDDKGAKEIWEPIKAQLPIYGLFKVDRNNQDQDSEAQDPFKVAIKEILKSEDVRSSIEELKGKVRTAYEIIARDTIEELQKINPAIAGQLHPDFGDPKIDSAFKPEINTDTGVPLNKRGSGVRRLVLLSFFKADVLRRKKEVATTDVIYAIEEPETSQHPEHQKLLIESLEQIAKESSVQVILTTHSAQLVKSLHFSTLRYISSIDGHPFVTAGEGVLPAAKMELGELPLIDQGYIICVEGRTDVKFFRTIGKLQCLREIFDISKASILPMNGGFVEKWAEEQYLKDCNVNEFHLYDRDADSKYSTTIEAVNSWDSCCGLLTELREIENYVHPDLINGHFGTTFTLDDEWHSTDIVRQCAQKSGLGDSCVKEIICGKLAAQMTEEHFAKMGTLDEVKRWFSEMKKVSGN